jgi:chromosome segregation ATPase
LKTVNTQKLEVEKSGTSLQKLTYARDEAERDRKEKEKQLQGHRNLLVEKETDRRRLQDQKMRIDADKARLMAQVEVLQQAERSMSGYSEGARLLIQAARQERLKGGYQLLSGLLDVPVEYETAFAALLGEFLDMVLLDARISPR